jgi:hypothetical protein
MKPARMMPCGQHNLHSVIYGIGLRCKSAYLQDVITRTGEASVKRLWNWPETGCHGEPDYLGQLASRADASA